MRENSCRAAHTARNGGFPSVGLCVLEMAAKLPPLDYSFFGIEELIGIVGEEPRHGKVATQKQRQGSAQQAAEQQSRSSQPTREAEDTQKKASTLTFSTMMDEMDAFGGHDSALAFFRSGQQSAQPEKSEEELRLEQEWPQYVALALKLNNNSLSTLNRFERVLSKVVVNFWNLTWIDLSSNSFTAIPEELLILEHLSVLYMHDNRIEDMSSLSRLGKLQELKSLTLHGNPIETIPKYRWTVLTILAKQGLKLRSFDFTTLTPKDYQGIEVFQTLHRKLKTKCDKEEEPSKRRGQRRHDGSPKQAESSSSSSGSGTAATTKNSSPAGRQQKQRGR